MKDWYNRGYVFMMFLPVTSPFSSDLRFKKKRALRNCAGITLDGNSGQN
jgi:hypothetical protein